MKFFIFDIRNFRSFLFNITTYVIPNDISAVAKQIATNRIKEEGTNSTNTIATMGVVIVKAMHLRITSFTNEEYE